MVDSINRRGRSGAEFWLRVLLLSSILVFLVLFLRGLDYGILKQLRLDTGPLLASACFSLGFRYWGVYIWRGILRDLGTSQTPAFSVLASIYARSWMARYIPGTVPWIAGRVILARDLGISKSRLTVASVLEAGTQILGIAAISLLLLGIDGRLASQFEGRIGTVVLSIGLVFSLLLIPAIFNRLIRFVYKVLRGREAYAELATNSKATLRSLLLYAVGSLLAGISYYFMALAVWGSVSIRDLVFIIGAVNLSGVVGMAAPCVPSGLGVRDASQLVLLSVILPKEVALVLVVFSRLWSVIIDLVFVAVATLADTRQRA